MSEGDVTKGVLYVVATPIGHLDDISRRAVDVLKTTDVIAAEDTRHSGHLLGHLGIKTPCIALHDHNERMQAPKLVERMQQGETIALICDAGTPLVSDPGFHLVQAAIEAGIRCVPLPGASAVIAALSVAGLPTDRFSFEGFLPAKAGARDTRLQALAHETATLCFYVSPHRVLDELAAMQSALGDRQACLARELTKQFETLYYGSFTELQTILAEDKNATRGEMVLLVHGADKDAVLEHNVLKSMDALKDKLHGRDLVSAIEALTGAKRNAIKRLVESLK